MRRPSLKSLLANPTALLSWLPCLLFSVAAIWAFGEIAGRRPASAFAASLGWGALVLVSFLGWGTLLARRLFPAKTIDVGLRAAWGMALLVAVGGFLSLFCLISRGRLAALVAGGLFALALDLGARRREVVAGLRARSGLLANSPGALVGIAALALVALIQAAGSGLEQAFYWACDDMPAYLVFPAEMLSAGCSIQPFSVRGLNSYGGQPFLNALMMAELPVSYVYLFDRGLCLLIAFALVTGFPLRRKVLALLPLALLVTVPNIRANTTSTTSGAVMLLALFRTMELKPDGPSLRLGGVLALLAAATMSLRQSYLVPAAMTIAISYALMLARSEGNERRAALREAAAVALMILCLILPWALSTYRSARTFAYPLMAGNYHPDLGAYEVTRDLYKLPRRVWDNLAFERAIKTLPLFLLAGLMIREKERRAPFASLYWGTAMGAMALLLTFNWGEPGDNERVLLPLAVAISLGVLLTTLRRADEASAGETAPRWSEALLPAAIACAAALIQINETRVNAGKVYGGSIDLITQAVRTPPTFAEPSAETYRRLQNAIPPGARVLAMVDEPFRFDFRRNKIDVIDLVGMVSPPPRLPLESDDAFIGYLLDQDIRYFAFVRGDASQELYRTSIWTNLKRSQAPSHKALTPIFLQAFERAESVARARKVIYRADGMVVVDLAAGASGSGTVGIGGAGGGGSAVMPSASAPARFAPSSASTSFL